MRARRRRQAAWRRLKERILELQPQATERVAHCRLREPDPARRARHVALGPQRVERQQQVQVESFDMHALAARRPRHGVLLSSVGADLPSGNGPIASLYRAETRLAATGVKLTKLRAAYFMENWAGMAPPAKSDGVLPSMLTLGRAAPMV